MSDNQIHLFDIYLNELIEWNSRKNLIGIAERGRVIIELILDSLVPVPYLFSRGRMLDVGSGAGFPAVVIKLIAPDLKMHMVEANSKKASFLKQVVRLLKLNDVEVINGRIELIEDKIGLDGFEIISARALADLKQIINWCSHLLSDKGLLVYFSGSRVDETLKSCEDLMKERHLVVANSIPYHLPGMRDSRNLVILRKEEVSELKR